MLSRIYDSEGGVEVLDVLMKYLCVNSVSCSTLLIYRANDSLPSFHDLPFALPVP